MDLEAGSQLFATGDNEAKLGDNLKSLPRLERNEHETCLARTIKSLFIRIKHYFAVIGGNQNFTWITSIIDLYTWETFYERVTLKFANWFEIGQIIASYIPLASVSLTTIPAVSYLVSQTENPQLPPILDKMSNTYPEFKTIIYVSTIVWIIFTGFSVLHYFWKTKVRTASIPGFSMQHFYYTLVKLVAIGVDLSIVNLLIRVGTKWECLPFLLIYILLIIVISFHWLRCGEDWDDMELMVYLSDNLENIEVEPFYKAYRKENPGEMYKLPTVTERIRNIGGSADEDARNGENPVGEADH